MKTTRLSLSRSHVPWAVRFRRCPAGRVRPCGAEQGVRASRLAPDRRGTTFPLSPLSVVSYMAFIMLRRIPSTPGLLRGLILKGCCMLSSAFSASIEMIP